MRKSDRVVILTRLTKVPGSDCCEFCIIRNAYVSSAESLASKRPLGTSPEPHRLALCAKQAAEAAQD